VISFGTWAAAEAACAAAAAGSGGAACIPLAALAALIFVAEGAQVFATLVRGALHACSDGQIARCGLLVAGGAVAAYAVWQGGRVGLSLSKVYFAKRAYVAALESGAHSALASGAVGVAKSDLLAALRFERVVDREVKVCHEVLKVCARLDSITEDIFGRRRGVESKNGMAAKFTKNQQDVYPQLKSGSGYSFPGSSPGMALRSFEVQHWGAGGRSLALP